VKGAIPVLLHPDRLAAPLRWQKPRRIFVCSLADLFHPAVPDEFIDRVFAVIALAERHTFLLLTKRPERMRAYLTARARDRDWAWCNQVEGIMKSSEASTLPHACERWPLPNVHLGVSVENQHWADERIPILRDTPAAVRWVSLEPLLGPVDLGGYIGMRLIQGGVWAPGLDWVVVGGESGAGHRKLQHGWVYDIQAQCAAAGVAFWGKQDCGPHAGIPLGGGLDVHQWPADPALDAAKALP